MKKKARDKIWLILIIIRHGLYMLSRVFDNLSAKPPPQAQLQFKSYPSYLFLQLYYLRSDFSSTMKLYFVGSQIRWIIPWSLTILNIIHFYSILVAMMCFLIQTISTFKKTTCIFTFMQIICTTLNYSFATNTKAQVSSLVFSQICLLAQIIQMSHSLLIRSASTLQGKSKDLSILYLSLTIANQMLIMDLMFRGVYEQKVQQYQIKVTIKQYVKLNSKHNTYVNSQTQ